MYEDTVMIFGALWLLFCALYKYTYLLTLRHCHNVYQLCRHISQLGMHGRIAMRWGPAEVPQPPISDSFLSVTGVYIHVYNSHCYIIISPILLNHFHDNNVDSKAQINFRMYTRR